MLTARQAAGGSIRSALLTSELALIGNVWLPAVTEETGAEASENPTSPVLSVCSVSQHSKRFNLSNYTTSLLALFDFSIATVAEECI